MDRICAIHYGIGKSIEVEYDVQGILSVRQAECPAAGLPYIAPGFVDLQVNGYGGTDFNSAPDPSAIRDITLKLRKKGVNTYFPTVITNSPDRIREAVSAIRLAAEEFDDVEASVGGIHLEGPFISTEDGPRGAHDRQYVQPPDWDLFNLWQEAADGRIRLVTVSPEWPGACDFIAKFTAQGIVVSIGHTAASPEQIRAAADAGARMSTHLGNGAHPMLPRHPNYIWEQLAADELAACVIADGFHLPDSVLKVVLKMKGNKAAVVSDCVSLAGMPPGEYNLHIGGAVVLSEEGRLFMAGNPKLLAGSAQPQIWGVNHLIERGICDVATAIDLASINPAALMDLPQQKGISEGAPADFILFTRNACGIIELLGACKRGEMTT